MKKVLLILLLCVTAFISCKNDSKPDNTETTSIDSEERTTKQSDGLTLLKGEFVYFDGAAVLQTHSEIYGILITDKLEALNKEAKQYKADPTDMVQVEVRGKITNRKDEKILWEHKVEIIEILSVNPIPKENNNIIKLEN